MESEFLGRALSGEVAPEIDGELASDGHDGLLACGARGLGSSAQDLQALGDGWVSGLEADESPGEFDQSGAQAWVPVLGH